MRNQLTKEGLNTLTCSKEAKLFGELAINNTLLGITFEITRFKRRYICDAQVVGDLGNVQQAKSDGRTKIEAISLAVEDLFYQSTLDNNLIKLFPLLYRPLMKEQWIDPNLHTAVNILNEMQQNGVIKDLEYKYEQKGNNDNGDPLWMCNVKAKMFYYFKEPELMDVTTIQPLHSKIEAKKMASLILMYYILADYNMINVI